MSAKPIFNAVGYQPGFSIPARSLALQSLNDVVAVGEWAQTPHPYAQCRQEKIDVMQSAKQAWAVRRERDKGETVSELLTSRLAVYAGVPVAPVFLQSSRGKNFKLLSVIPFEQVAFKDDGKLDSATYYMRHYASTLPFLLWLGNKTDRWAGNHVMNAEAPEQFAEFDFGTSDIERLLSADTWNANYYKDMRLVQMQMTQKNYTFDLSLMVNLPTNPISRPHFEAGLQAVEAISDDTLTTVIADIDREAPMRAEQISLLTDYLGARRINLRQSFNEGHFDSRLVCELPAQRRVAGLQTALAGLQNAISARTYRF